ncbi:MAG: LysR family transcriptional regulator [Pseudomonadota bacterium]
MRFKRLDLNLLVALDALLVERSITRAARRLNLSQSATSGVLSRLREYFEDEVLVQVGRNMILTPLAQSLCDPVRNVLMQIQSTIETKPAFVPEQSSRHFRVIASNYPTSVLLADVAQHLSWHAPNVTMEIVALDDAYLEQLDRGEVDLLIMPTKYVAPDHPSEVLFEDSYSCVVWSGNTLVGDSLALEQYMALSHVSTTFGSSRQQPSFEEWFLKSTGHTRRVDITTSDFNTLPQMVIGTNRIATMHRRLARMFARYYPLRLLPAPLDIPQMVMTMQWHKFFDKDPSHIWFRDLLRSMAGSEKMHVDGC